MRIALIRNGVVVNVILADDVTGLAFAATLGFDSVVDVSALAAGPGDSYSESVFAAGNGTPPPLDGMQTLIAALATNAAITPTQAAAVIDAFTTFGA
jgi:hypothetical protein